MRRATVRQLLHNVTGVMRWVADGETVEVTKRGKVIAELRPPVPEKPRKPEWPDFAARARSYCDGVFLTTEQAAAVIAESRGDE